MVTVFTSVPPACLVTVTVTVTSCCSLLLRLEPVLIFPETVVSPMFTGSTFDLAGLRLTPWGTSSGEISRPSASVSAGVGAFFSAGAVSSVSEGASDASSGFAASAFAGACCFSAGAVSSGFAGAASGFTGASFGVSADLAASGSAFAGASAGFSASAFSTTAAGGCAATAIAGVNDPKIMESARTKAPTLWNRNPLRVLAFFVSLMFIFTSSVLLSFSMAGSLSGTPVVCPYFFISIVSCFAMFSNSVFISRRGKERA